MTVLFTLCSRNRSGEHLRTLPLTAGADGKFPYFSATRTCGMLGIFENTKAIKIQRLCSGQVQVAVLSEG